MFVINKKIFIQILRHWKISVKTIAGQFQAMCYDDIKNFGRLFRVWILNTPQILVASAEHAEKFLQGMQHHTKSSNYRFLHAWMGTGLLTSQGECLYFIDCP